MKSPLACTHRALLVAMALGCGLDAFAGQELASVEAPFRAKIAKEKIRAAAQERKMAEQEKNQNEKSLEQSSCGSQSIGNVDTGGHPGTSPREVFVFAPNAINIVGRGSCQ